MKYLRRITKQPAILLLVIWFSFAWSWTLQTDSLDLAGSKKQGMILAVIVSAFNIAVSTAIIWNMIRIVRWVFRTYSRWISIGLSLALFALADFLVSWLSTIIWIGPEGQVDNILPLSSPTLM